MLKLGVSREAMEAMGDISAFSSGHGVPDVDVEQSRHAARDELRRPN